MKAASRSEGERVPVRAAASHVLVAPSHGDDHCLLDALPIAAGTFCLNDGRFRVYAQWALADGERGWGNVRAFTGDSGYSTFFDPANIELVVKVLDGCSYNGRFWVFAAGLTNVTVDLWVYDTEQDEYWTHHSPVDTAFQPVQDTTAFATCPH